MGGKGRSILSRRTFLRGVLAGGVSVAVPLPRLFGMLNGSGTAYANGTPLPVRYGTWFFGNGIIPERWAPRATGAGSAWTLSEQLAPLFEIKPWLSVVSGFSITVPNTSPHSSMPSQALTGANYNGTVQLPTIDQLIAPAISGSVVFPTGLHVAISNTSGGALPYVSYNGPNAPNQPEYGPAALFQKLLQFSNTSGSPKPPDPELLRRSLVLDAVAADAKSLRGRLGADDQKRLDLHLDGLNQLELQIAAQQVPKATGLITDPDKAYPNRGNDGAITRQRGQAFSDLLVFAMASDLTRVFTYMFSPPACHGNYVDCGLDPVTFHEDYGHRLSPKGITYATAGFNTGVIFAMSCLGDTLVRMKNTPDGSGTLLDNSCVYATSCVAASQTHGGTDFPLLVAGKAGGKLKGDQHIRTVGENVSDVPFTLLKTLGGTASSFGQNEGQTSTTVSGLLA